MYNCTQTVCCASIRKKCAGRAARGWVRFGRASGAMTIFDLVYGSNTRRQSVSMNQLAPG
jgi:hypothetical protein